MNLFFAIRKVVAAVLAGALGLGMIYVGFDQHSTASDLKEKGVEVAGEVINARQSRGRTTNYYLGVRYTPRSSDSPVEKEFTVSSGGFKKFPRGSTVKVRHLPQDPKIAQLVGEEANGYFLLVIGSAMIFGGAVRLSSPFLGNTH